MKRFKVIGKKRFARLPYDIITANKKLVRAVNSLDKNGDMVCIKPKSGKYYRFYQKLDGKTLFENFLIIADITADSEGTKIEYRYVFDMISYITTRLLSVLCVLVPIITGLIAGFVYKKTNFLVYLPLAVVALIGVGSFYFFREDRQKADPMVERFERFLVETFNDNQE